MPYKKFTIEEFIIDSSLLRIYDNTTGKREGANRMSKWKRLNLVTKRGHPKPGELVALRLVPAVYL
jgi:hypothetical protein